MLIRTILDEISLDAVVAEGEKIPGRK